MLSRRKCMIALGMSPIAGALAASSRQDGRKLPVVGVLWHAGSAEEEGKYFVALLEGMRGQGYVDGDNVVLEHRFADERYELFTRRAAELVQLDPDILVAVTRPAALSLQRTGTTIPIVFLIVPDPVAAGLVQSLARPGGHITGFSNIATELNAKRLELLKRAVPGLERVALLLNPSDAGVADRTTDDLRVAGDALKIDVVPVEARQPSEFEGAFQQIAGAKVGGLVTAIDPLFFAGRVRLAQLAIAQRLPSIHVNGDAVDAGFLLSYGANHEAIFRRTGLYVDRILKGTAPRDLPVEQPTTFEFCINMKTAKSVGLNIPASVRQLADRLIA